MGIECSLPHAARSFGLWPDLAVGENGTVAMNAKKSKTTPDTQMRSKYVRVFWVAISGLSLALLGALVWLMCQHDNREDARWPLAVAGLLLAPLGLVWLLSLRGLSWVTEWEIHAVMREFANEYNLRLIDDGTREMSDAVRGYIISPPLDRRCQRLGSGRRVAYTSIIQGKTEGVRLAAFQYTFTGGSMGGRSGARIRLTICTLTDLPSQLPRFHLGRKRVFLASSPSLRDGIHLTGSPAADSFSKNYVLVGDNEHGIRRSFAGELLEFFADHPGWTAQSDGTWFVLWRDKTPLTYSYDWELCRNVICGPRSWLYREVNETLDAGIHIGHILNRQG